MHPNFNYEAIIWDIITDANKAETMKPFWRHNYSWQHKTVPDDSRDMLHQVEISSHKTVLCACEKLWSEANVRLIQYQGLPSASAVIHHLWCIPIFWELHPLSSQANQIQVCYNLWQKDSLNHWKRHPVEIQNLIRQAVKLSSSWNWRGQLKEPILLSRNIQKDHALQPSASFGLSSNKFYPSIQSGFVVLVPKTLGSTNNLSIY